MPDLIDQTRSTSNIKTQLVGMLNDKQIERAILLFDDHSQEVNEAIREYNTKTHSIMQRGDKVRKNKSDYQTNRLPRNWQQYINEIELYFFINNGVLWELLNDEKEQEELADVFNKFQKFLKEMHYDSKTREAKRWAGAETECAKLYARYKDEDDKDQYKLVVIKTSDGYKLRPMFNRYGDMKAFAIGFQTKDSEGMITDCWEIYTKETIYHCTRPVASGTGSNEWIVDKEDNTFKKIPVIYYRQPKAWEGVQERIERDEWLDSKNADCNEYFADPVLKMSKSVKNGLYNAKEVGKVIQVGSKDDIFEYVTPPEATDMKAQEKSIIKESILNGSFTPDFSYENVKGLGAISGEAITKANVLGYIKRLSRMEIYDELFEREANLIKEIMAEAMYPADREKIRRMELHHVFQDPSIGLSDNSEEIQRWKEIGMSIEAIVDANRNVRNKPLEVARIKRERAEALKQQSNIKTTEE